MSHVPEVAVPERLQGVLDELGSDAHRWLGQVPTQLAATVDAWELTLGPQLHHDGCTSLVFPATTADGEAAILKLTVPHDDALGEAPALARWAGDGAARLLRHSADGLTLLLERCVPGHDLWSLPVDGQIEIIGRLLPRLWVEPDDELPVRELDDTIADWERRMRDAPATFDAPAEVVGAAAGWAAELRTTSERRVLLHGDLNPGNVLTAGREPWLAIDPKPWLGDPAFDLGQALINWISDSDTEPVRATVARASRLAEQVDVDVGRALRWATVKVVGWGDGYDAAVVLHAAADAA